MRQPSKDQFVGCLLGQCLGDSVGFVKEGDSTKACVTYVEEILRPRKIGQIKWGQYSDDSQLAREILLSYVSKGTFDQRDCARRFMLLFDANRVVGAGLATARAAHRLARGVGLDEAGEPSPSAGNGTAGQRMGRHFSFCNNKRALESLLVPEDYWESICTAVFPGGDVDTTAAMTGAVSGAHVGIEGIPDDWARRVTDLGEWEYNDLVILATRCYELRSKTDHY